MSHSAAFDLDPIFSGLYVKVLWINMTIFCQNKGMAMCAFCGNLLLLCWEDKGMNCTSIAIIMVIECGSLVFNVAC